VCGCVSGFYKSMEFSPLYKLTVFYPVKIFPRNLRNVKFLLPNSKHSAFTCPYAKPHKSMPFDALSVRSVLILS
jgi:hypothetical protein